MACILVVDDDEHIRELIHLNLREEGYEVIEASCGEEALLSMKKRRIDLVIMDIMMPQIDGWELCRRMRQMNEELPLLMVTAKGETAHKIKGFRLGADDYIVKPFDPQELMARVKVQLKRYRTVFSRQLQIGDVELNRSTYMVRRGSERLVLPLKEFELLFKLASFPGQIFTRNQLIEDLWGHDYVGDDRTVDVHIKRLRERFEHNADSFVITTIRGLGYKLEATEP
ncbi:response regulator transcription factor [Paenibacillus sp. y28]|uniref:response regulator transcription factor n=1 Tax=Paenibacillus sp. y28 TaxID=3129110 RepID=UPI003018409D